MLSRDDFIKTIWKPYPEPLTESNGFVFGRVFEIYESSLSLHNQNGVTTLITQEATTENPVLGPAVPLNLLIKGDVIGWERDSKNCFLLSPCLEPNPKMFDQKVQLWSDFLDKVSHFFKSRGFLHTPTPTLVESPGVDHHIHYLEATGVQSGRFWSLPTSPEIALKKLLCQGYERIYEIKNVFRDDFNGPHHKPEFTMVEWYRSFEGLSAIEEDLRELVQTFSSHSLKFESLSVAEAFKKYVGFELTPNTGMRELVGICNRLGIHYQQDDDWNDLFFRIFMERVEKNLGQEGPCFLWHFPAQQSSLSQVNEAGWCERFELYWNGVELANAYLEVNDPEENQKRFVSQMEMRESSGFKPSKMDLDFFSQMKSGMPPASGVALGLDRLHMILLGKEQIY